MGLSQSKTSDKSASDAKNKVISYNDGVNYLVAGFFPKTWKKYKLELIKKNICEYLGNVFLRFDVYPSGVQDIIKNNGYTLNKIGDGFHNYNKSFMIGCSYGFNGIGVYNIKIKVLHNGNEQGSIGIITNINECKKMTQTFDINGWGCYYNGGFQEDYIECFQDARIEIANNLNAGSSFHFHTLYNQDCIWKKNDIITINLDLDQNLLKFYKNNKLIKNHKHLAKGKICIPKNKTYYIVVSIASSSEQNTTYMIWDVK